MVFDSLPEIVTPEEVAQLFRVKTDGIMKAARDGELKAYKIGKFWRMKKSDVMEWIEKSTTGKE